MENMAPRPASAHVRPRQGHMALVPHWSPRVSPALGSLLRAPAETWHVPTIRVRPGLYPWEATSCGSPGLQFLESRGWTTTCGVPKTRTQTS